METLRRCGWLGPHSTKPRLVWARSAIALDSCPVSYVTAESLVLVQEFVAWRQSSVAGLLSLPARTAEAFCILEKELKSEIKSEQQRA